MNAVQTDTFKVPTVMRYKRVQAILENEPAFREQLGEKDKEVSKRNGQPHFFSPKVIEVTEAIHRAGLDAYNIQRPQVLRFAMEAFGLEHPGTPEKKEVLVPAPVASSLPEKNGKHRKVRISKKDKLITPAVPFVPPPSDEVEEEPAVVEKSRISAKPITYQVNMAVFTLLCAVMNLAERDGAPGADKRLQKVESLMDDYEKVKDYPSKSA